MVIELPAIEFKFSEILNVEESVHILSLGFLPLFRRSCFRCVFTRLDWYNGAGSVPLTNRKELTDHPLLLCMTFLLFFSLGSGTLYDLRHTLTVVEPNRARWDYHVAHINLMATMATIDSDPIFASLRDRWLGYMKGHRSKHN